MIASAARTDMFAFSDRQWRVKATIAAPTAVSHASAFASCSKCTHNGPNFRGQVWISSSGNSIAIAMADHGASSARSRAAIRRSSIVGRCGADMGNPVKVEFYPHVYYLSR